MPARPARGCAPAVSCRLRRCACGWRPADGGHPSLPPLGSDDVVLAFGDSITLRGRRASEGETYPEVLAQLIGRPVVRDGVPGEVTAQGLARLPASLDEYRPKLLLLCLGGNDMLRDLDPAATEANLREMVKLARSRGVAVVLIAVPKTAPDRRCSRVLPARSRRAGRSPRGRSAGRRAARQPVQVRHDPSQRAGIPQDGASAG